jgi:predicted ArsR family transcriptional regulator
VERKEQFLAVAALGDIVRWDLYRFVRRQSGSVTREEAARALRISIKLAAFHLDKLVDRGLLRADHEVPRGVRRRVGRAPKRYAPADVEVSLSVPERHYQLVGEILVDTLAQVDAGEAGESTVERARRIAWGRGERLGTEVSEGRRPGRLGPERTVVATEDLLEKHGYEPVDDGDGGLLLRNCPFHALVHRAPDLVCSINAAFVDGVLRGLGNDSVRADLQPEAGVCCVRVRPPRPAWTALPPMKAV